MGARSLIVVRKLSHSLNGGTGVDQSRRLVRDLRDGREPSEAVYEAVFQVGLEKLESPDPDEMEMWAFRMHADAPGAAGAIVRMNGFGPGRNSTLVYFSCEDCAVEAKRAAANGGAIVKEKVSIGAYGNMALVTDPEGNMIGLHSMS